MSKSKAKSRAKGQKAEEPTTIEWTVHPAKDQPLRAISVGILIVGTGATATWWFHAPMWGVIATVLLTVMLLPFLVRTTYTLTPDSIDVQTAFYSFSRPLSAFKSFEMGQGRAWLCTHRSRTLLDNYRGMLLLLGPHAERVREALLERGLVTRRPEGPQEAEK
ncbi:MAG: hypothetical protein GF320_15740 [Armatimonadia bacterium]|nr:hypothetical protein [Armatimonadia bacterium]